MIKLKIIAVVICALCMNAWGFNDEWYQELCDILHESREYNQEVVRTLDELLETKDIAHADTKLKALESRVARLSGRMQKMRRDIELQGDYEPKLVELLSASRYEAMLQGWEARKKADMLNILKSRGEMPDVWTEKSIGIVVIQLPARFNDTVTRTRKIMDEFEQQGMELRHRLEAVRDTQTADKAAQDVKTYMDQIQNKLGVICEYTIDDPNSAKSILEEMHERFYAMYVEIGKVVDRMKEHQFFGSGQLQDICLIWWPVIEEELSE